MFPRPVIPAMTKHENAKCVAPSCRRRSGSRGPAAGRHRGSGGPLAPVAGSYSLEVAHAHEGRRETGRSQTGEVDWTALRGPAGVNPQGQAQGRGSGRPHTVKGARPSCAQSARCQPASTRLRMQARSSGRARGCAGGCARGPPRALLAAVCGQEPRFQGQHRTKDFSRGQCLRSWT